MVSTTDVVPAVFKEGERFAQFLILPVPQVEFTESQELSKTDRGDEGFGSTGNNVLDSAAQDKPVTIEASEQVNQQPAAGQEDPEEAK